MRALLFITFLIAVGYARGDTLEDYAANQLDNHAYKIMYIAETWDIAKETCAKEGAKLAVPKSKEQFLFIQQMVRRMYYPSIVGASNRLLVWLGINNRDNHKIWVNIDGENIESTGFHDWAGGNGQDTRPDPREPHCVVMDAVNPGLRDYWCHLRQPYVCEKINN